MQFLQSITSLSKDVLLAAGAVVALLILIAARYGRRRYLVIEHIEAAEVIALQLGRIADAIERLSPLPHTQPPPREEEKSTRRVSMSMFNR